jgi:hypothetical protein
MPKYSTILATIVGLVSPYAVGFSGTPLLGLFEDPLSRSRSGYDRLSPIFTGHYTAKTDL